MSPRLLREAREQQEAEDQLEQELKRIRTEAAEAAAAAADGCGSSVGEAGRASKVEAWAWARERAVLSYGSARRWGGRLRQQHKAMLGQELIRGSLMAPAASVAPGSTADASSSRTGGADGSGTWDAWHAGARVPAAGSAGAGALRGPRPCEADVVTGAGNVSLAHTRAFMRAWRVEALAAASACGWRGEGSSGSGARGGGAGGGGRPGGWPGV